jgi:hypothetical protein
MYPYQTSRPPPNQQGSLPVYRDDLSDEPYRRFSAVPLICLAGEGLLAAWANWQMQSELAWAWPVVIVTAYAAYFGLWLIAGTSAAAMVLALLSLAAPAGDVVARALATLGLLGHSVVLSVVVYALARWY